MRCSQMYNQIVNILVNANILVSFSLQSNFTEVQPVQIAQRLSQIFHFNLTHLSKGQTLHSQQRPLNYQLV